jgi:hypothetical protein
MILSDLLAEAVALLVILAGSAGAIGFVVGWWVRGNL